jgi:hypothetical protein
MLLRPTCLVLVLVSLSACGRKASDDDRDPKVQQVTFDEAFAENYFVDDVDCMGGEGGKVTRAPVHMWQGDGTRPINYVFADTSAKASLAGPSISETYYNFHQRAACDVVDGQVVCPDKVTLVKEPLPLKLCRPEGPYARASVEGVGLASYANLATAYDFYQSLPGRSTALLKSRLLVLPTVEKRYELKGEKKRQISTDNLAYTPDFAGQPAFIVYPKGRRTKEDGLWKDLNLWELPWAMAHEYGHHIFRTHTRVTRLGSENPTSLGDVLPIHSFDDAAASNLRSVGGTEYWGATNEAFADLFSYYTHGGEPGLVDGVDCFDESRATESSSFFNGEAKRLDEEILGIFTSSSTVARGTCKNPNFQDIHAIGAIIAYGVNRLFDTAVNETHGAVAARTKAELLLQWAERLGALARTTSPANLNFALILKEAMTVTANAGVATAEQCAVMRDVFPAVDSGC